MKLLLALSILIGGVLLYRMKLADDGRELEGRWTIVSVPDGWKKVPGMDVMVTGEEIQIRMGTVATSKLRYTLDPGSRTIEAVHGNEAARLGVYRLENDILTLSVGAAGKPRPESPDSTEDGAMNWVLKRGAHL